MKSEGQLISRSIEGYKRAVVYFVLIIIYVHICPAAAALVVPGLDKTETDNANNKQFEVDIPPSLSL